MLISKDFQLLCIIIKSNQKGVKTKWEDTEMKF